MDEPALSLADGLRLTGLGHTELHFRCLSLGAVGDLAEFRRHLEGVHVDGHVDNQADDHEHNVIAQVLNEALHERGQVPAVAYRNLFRLAAPAVETG